MVEDVRLISVVDVIMGVLLYELGQDSVLPGIHGFWIDSFSLSLHVVEANPPPGLEFQMSHLCCQLLGLGLKDGARDGDVTGIGLPHSGMQGIIHIPKVNLLHPRVLGTKALGLISFLVVISLLEPGGEGVDGYIKVLGNLSLSLEFLLHLHDGLVLCIVLVLCLVAIVILEAMTITHY